MVIVAQCIHYTVSTRTTVENITKNVQTVYYKTLDKVADCCNEVLGTACAYDGLYNYIEVGLFVLIVVGLVQKLFDDVGILFGQALAHL